MNDQSDVAVKITTAYRTNNVQGINALRSHSLILPKVRP